MDATTGTVASSAVQIGDPNTEKGVMELVEEARDRGLYRAVTDCGAGGLSSAVGELAAEVGVAVDLRLAPRKYAGLRPWEVWLSESQERMVLAVPPEHLDELVELGRRWSVEVTAIGTLTGDGRLRVSHGERTVVDLPMGFLHGGCPRRRMEATYREPAGEPSPATPPAALPPAELGALLLEMLADPTVASKQAVTGSYDHEVRGGTLVRPWCGPGGDGSSDGVALVPLGCWDGPGAFALAVGINPAYGADPYRMALSAIDEVFRNLVAVGADPDRVALLDNFCWGNPTFPDRLGSLVRAAQGCHDGAIAYGAPFVSGKDSLYNEFDGRPIPPTLLITGLGHVPDRRHVVGAVPRADGGALYLVGETRAELGGSLLHRLLGRPGGDVPDLPSPSPLDSYRALHRAMRAGLVVAAHDPSEGGLGVALAELAIAGRVGIDAVVPATTGAAAGAVALEPGEALFSESNGRLVVQVAAGAAEAFEAAMVDAPVARVGRVTAAEAGLRVAVGTGRPTLQLGLGPLVAAFTGAAREGARP
jgi:phosphoribosylformylglycinamidine synthase